MPRTLTPLALALAACGTQHPEVRGGTPAQRAEVEQDVDARDDDATLDTFVRPEP